MIKLRIDGKGDVSEREFAVLPVRLGRSAEADCPIEDVKASRVHAEIGRCDAGYVLTDLDSHNGTWLNGIKAEAKAEPVKTGDVIRIGSTTITLLHLEGPEAMSPPAPVLPRPRRRSTPTSGSSAGLIFAALVVIALLVGGAIAMDHPEWFRPGSVPAPPRPVAGSPPSPSAPEGPDPAFSFGVQGVTALLENHQYQEALAILRTLPKRGNEASIATLTSKVLSAIRDDYVQTAQQAKAMAYPDAIAHYREHAPRFHGTRFGVTMIQKAETLRMLQRAKVPLEGPGDAPRPEPGLALDPEPDPGPDPGPPPGSDPVVKAHEKPSLTRDTKQDPLPIPPNPCSADGIVAKFFCIGCDTQVEGRHQLEMKQGGKIVVLCGRCRKPAERVEICLKMEGIFYVPTCHPDRKSTSPVECCGQTHAKPTILFDKARVLYACPACGSWGKSAREVIHWKACPDPDALLRRVCEKSGQGAHVSE
jgi:hypothetical protein